MNTTIRVKRYNPEKGEYYSEYQVEAEESMRLVDALEQLARTQDSSLGFRRSCVHGVCGSDAMRINGKEALACKTLLGDVSTVENGFQVEIEPLRNLEVKKDLLLDQQVLFDKYRLVKPYFMPKQIPEDGREYLQSPKEQAIIDEASACIGCGACYSACPVLQKNPLFLGPMALVQAVRFINDTRDLGLAPRIDVLDTENGAWACENMFECTKVCPRDIKITKLINSAKRQIKRYRTEETAVKQKTQTEEPSYGAKP